MTSIILFASLSLASLAALWLIDRWKERITITEVSNKEAEITWASPRREKCPGCGAVSLAKMYSAKDPRSSIGYTCHACHGYFSLMGDPVGTTAEPSCSATIAVSGTAVCLPGHRVISGRQS